MLGRRKRVLMALAAGGIMWLLFCALWCIAIESNLYI